MLLQDSGSTGQTDRPTRTHDPAVDAAPTTGPGDRTRLAGRTVVVLVVVLGLAVTGWIALLQQRAAHNETRAALAAVADRTAADIESILAAELAGLTVLRNQVVMQWPVSRPWFHSIVEAAYQSGLFPATAAVEVIRQVETDGIDDFVARTTADESLDSLGYPPLEVATADVPTTLVIDYIAPIVGNEAAFGLNLANAPGGRLDVSFRARDSGEASATPPIDLAQGGRGLLVDVPLYGSGRLPTSLAGRQATFKGVLSALLRLDDLLGPVVTAEPGVAIALEDVSGEQPVSLLSEDPTQPGHPDTVTTTLEVADRIWQVRVHPLPGAAGADGSGPTVVVGVLMTALVALAVAAVDAARRRADRAAEEEQAARAELAELNHQLEDRIEARTAELARSNADLEQFAYLASHDLQEPLRQVSMFVDRIAERYGDLLDDRGHEYMGFVTGGTARMRLLIQDLLEYSRVGRNEPSRVPVGLHELLEEVAADLDLRIAETGATMRRGEDVELQTDPLLVSRTLLNLVGNAISHARPGAAPTIEVTAVPCDEGWEVRVDDDGTGIPDAHRDRAFELFERLGSVDARGTGMGLAICRRSVELLGGRIWIEDSPLGGARLAFTVPGAALAVSTGATPFGAGTSTRGDA